MQNEIESRKSSLVKNRSHDEKYYGSDGFVGNDVNDLDNDVFDINDTEKNFDSQDDIKIVIFL